MKFEAFCKRMQAFATDLGIEVRCHNDEEIGKYSAQFSDETVITGRPSSRKVTVRYGSGHQMMAVI